MSKLKRVWYNPWLPKVLMFLTILFVSGIYVNEAFADIGNHIRHSKGRKSSGSSSRGTGGSSRSGDGSGFEIILQLIIIVLQLFMIGFKIHPIVGVLWLVVCGIGVFFAVRYFIKNYKKILNKKNELANTFNNLKSGVVEPKVDQKAIIQSIQKTDPDFNPEDFIVFAKDCFVKLQHAWSTKNWDIARQFESKELFEQHYMQLNEFVSSGKTNKVERINVKNARYFKYTQDDTYDILEVKLDVILRDYITNDYDGKVLEGDPNLDIYMDYKLTFIRSKSVKTTKKLGKLEQCVCPGCSAPLSVNASGKCEYCGTVMNTGEHNWVLNIIEGEEK